MGGINKNPNFLVNNFLFMLFETNLVAMLFALMSIGNSQNYKYLSFFQFNEEKNPNFLCVCPTNARI